MASAPAAGPPKGLPRVIGGYRVLREQRQGQGQEQEQGPRRGRLGPVVLARHRATGGLVALTVLKPEWACLPLFVSRLVRDAFAAAQVEHPNLVRLVALGEARGWYYFAMERIEGETLAARMARQGPLPAREAVVHALQAARGLMFAHGQGLTHGDVRPGDIHVDAEGVTRLAGLGLVKTPAWVAADEAREAKGPIPLGEKGAEAARAAVQADLRCLGRTLHELLTGAPAGAGPGAGPEDAGAPDAPGPIAPAPGLPANQPELIANLGASASATRPGRGYTEIAQAVAAFSRFLEADTPGASAPGAEDTHSLVECAAAFRAAPAATLRRRIVRWSAAGCALLVLLSLLARQPQVAAGFAGLGLTTALAYFVIHGVAGRTALFTKVRGLVLESRGDWLMGLAGALLLATTLAVLHLHWAYLGFAILGVLLALALHFEVDRKVEAERRGAVLAAKSRLKALRLQGVGEETLRRFVRSMAGDDWEEFFEALFGFAAVRVARTPADRGLRRFLRTRSVPWRDWVASWVEARQEERRQAREEPFLQAIEERGLVVEGVNLLTARRKSRRIAAAMVAVAAEIRAARAGAATESLAPSGAAGPPSIARAIRAAAEAPEQVLVEREPGLSRAEASWTWLWELLLGARMRFLLGTALVVGCLLWVDQNQIVSGAQVHDAATRVLAHPDPLQALRDARIDVRVPARTEPLRLAILPRPLARLFDGFPAGAAGLILLGSALFPGARMGLFALPGAAIALLGPAAGIPRIGPLDASMVSMAVGAGVALLGAVFGKGRAGSGGAPGPW